MNYEVHITINGNEIWIHTEGLKFDLANPNSVEQIKALFSDLDHLRESIADAQRDHYLLKVYGKTRQQIMASLPVL